MVSYTASLQLPNPTPGDPAVRNIWGTIENNGRTLVDQAYGGELPLTVTNGTTILTSTQGAVDQSRNRRFVLTGTLTANVIILWPNGLNRFFSVQNNTTGAFSVTLGVDNGSGSPAGATLVVPQTQRMDCLSDGTNISPLFNATGGSLSVNGNLSVTGAFSIANLSVSGVLSVGSNTATSATVTINGAAGSARLLNFQTAGLNRWYAYTDQTAESGGNAGSNLSIARFNDAGATIDFPLTITRSSGLVSIKNQLQIGNNAVDNSLLGLVVNGNSSTTRQIGLTTNSGYRWKIVADPTAESSTSTGSNFVVYRYDNSGNFIDAPFTIRRSDALTFIGSGLQINSAGLSVIAGGLNVQAGGATITGASTISGSTTINGAGANLVVNGGTLTVAGGMTSTGGNLSISGTGVFGSTVSATDFIQTSDARLKVDIATLVVDDAAIDKLRPVTFRFGEKLPSQMGFIAQEVEEVFPLAVLTTDDDRKHISVMAMVAALVGEVQALRRRVAELEGAR